MLKLSTHSISTSHPTDKIFKLKLIDFKMQNGRERIIDGAKHSFFILFCSILVQHERLMPAFKLNFQYNTIVYYSYETVDEERGNC